MSTSLTQQLDLFARRLAPLGLTLILVLLETIRLPVPGIFAVSPALSIIAIYFWAIHRPDLMPPVAAFLVGLLLDTVSGSVLGVNALILLLTYGLVVGQRRLLIDKGFNTLWTGFLFTVIATGFLTWTLHSMIHGTLLNPGPLVIQLLVTAILYPPVAWLLGRSTRSVVREI